MSVERQIPADIGELAVLAEGEGDALLALQC